MSIRALLLAILPLAAVAQDLTMTGLGGVGLMTADLEASRQFYTGSLGYSAAFTLKDDRGKVVSTFFKVNDEQFIQVTVGPYTDIRLAYVAVLTPDAQALRKAVLKRGVIPGPAGPAPDQGIAFSLKDADATRIDFVERTPDSLQAKLRGKLLPARRVSRRISHVGVLSSDFDRSIAFYNGRFGFEETWRGGPRDGETRWINMRLPGTSTDYLELMLYTGQPTRDEYGSMQHICLMTPDIRAAIAQLAENGYAGADKLQPRIGRNGRRQVNLFDPDGTRIELMEPRPPK